MKRRKKNMKFIMLCICYVCILFGCGSKKAGTVDIVLKSDEIEKIQITLRPPNIEITVDDSSLIVEFVDICNEVVILSEDNSYEQYYGQWVEFVLVMKDGTSMTVTDYSPFIILDGVGYKAEYKQCEQLNAFANRVAETGW